MRPLTPLVRFLSRGMTNVAYTSEVCLPDPHVVSFVSRWGWLRDRLDVQIDGESVMSTYAASWLSLIHGESSQRFDINGQELLLRWRWTVWGDPLYIALVCRDQVAAIYGSQAAMQATPTTGKAAVSMIKSRLLGETLDSESQRVLAVEEYPFDNRFGSESITVDQEVSRTITSALTIEEAHTSKNEISAAVATVLKGQLANELSLKHNIVVGQALARRHTFHFSVSAGKAVLYLITWKHRVRSGSCSIEVSGRQYWIPYEVCFDLSYEITSKPFAESTQAVG